MRILKRKMNGLLMIIFIFFISVLFADGLNNKTEAQIRNTIQKEKAKNKGGKIAIEYISFPSVFAQYDVYPWDTVKHSDFSAAFINMLGQARYSEWLVQLTGTGNKNRMIRVFNEQFVLISCCKPHSCDSSQILILFNPPGKKCWSIYAREGRFEYLGNPDKKMTDLLKILLVEEYKEIYKGQS